VTVSIILVTYNTRQMTAKCIESIFEKTKGVDFEVILVDNASIDGSKEFFERDSRIKYVYSNENLGFGRGNNLGFEHASGKYIFLLNSDTLLVNDAVTEMFNYMENAPANIGCCGCVLQNREGKTIHSYYLTFPTLGWFFKEVVCFSIPKLYNPYKKDNKRMLQDSYPLEVRQITGADMFIRRCVIEKCGMFDSDFFMYFEETEMQHRFFINGYKSMIIDSPKIIHLEGASQKGKSGKRKNLLRKCNRVMRSRFIFAKKMLPKFQYVLFRSMHMMMFPRVLVSLSPVKDKLETISMLIFGVKLNSEKR